jgi:carbamoyl-phosphate synthase large subunit
MARIEYIHSKENLEVIIPNFDAELFPIIRLEKRLKAIGIHTLLPTEKQFEERQKMNLPEFGKKHMIKVPESKAVHNPAEILKISEEIHFPLLVKGKFYDAHVAFTVEQAKEYFHKISAKWGC